MHVLIITYDHIQIFSLIHKDVSKSDPGFPGIQIIRAQECSTNITTIIDLQIQYI